MADLFGGEVRKAATLSPCGVYRFELSRTWDDSLRPALFVMLNPSTADAERDDPTIRRCVRFARDWGFGGVVVVNLFALRAKDPRELYKHADPVGPDNDLAILAASDRCGVRVCAWGAHGSLHDRGRHIKSLLRVTDPRPVCHLGLTADGHPKHPLYLKATTTPVPFPES